MNLSISNIAWTNELDQEMYSFLQGNGIIGLEIAPTRLFPQNPYEHLEEAASFAVWLKIQYGLVISSIQSILFGVTENIFLSPDERAILTSRIKKAVDFAQSVNCENLVFGCPKNRSIPTGIFFAEYMQIAYSFFSNIGNYAAEHNVTIAIEPNPPCYNTNFLNTTMEAFEFCRQVNCKGIKVNVDLGTCIYNSENIDLINTNIDLVNHIHISEPMLAPIEIRSLHNELKSLKYDRFFSIEMKNINDIEAVKKIVRYIKEVFN
jgi:sugar phosphate isomerase/epimerase